MCLIFDERFRQTIRNPSACFFFYLSSIWLVSLLTSCETVAILSGRHGASVTCHEETESNGTPKGKAKNQGEYGSLLTRSFASSRSLACFASLHRYLFVRRRHPPCAWRFLFKDPDGVTLRLADKRIKRCCAYRRSNNPRAVFRSFSRGWPLRRMWYEVSSQTFEKTRSRWVLLIFLFGCCCYSLIYKTFMNWRCNFHIRLFIYQVFQLLT